MMTILKKLFQTQRESLEFFWERLDHEKVESFINKIYRCKGTLLLSGVGKSGVVAKKITSTLISTGINARFLCPVNALHGDLGAAVPDDISLLFTKSGSSSELLKLVPCLKQKGVESLAVVCRTESPLGKLCQEEICLPLQKELCPYNLVPTTSTVLQLMFGDILAVALMHHTQFNLDAYALNHPSGSIGKKLLLKVSDLMLTDSFLPLSCEDDLLINSLVELTNKRCGCLLVLNLEGKLTGIFTDGDLRRALQLYKADVMEMPLKNLMTKNPRSVEPNRFAWQAMQIMEEGFPVTVLPVLDGRKLIGLLRMHDLIQSGL